MWYDILKDLKPRDWHKHVDTLTQDGKPFLVRNLSDQLEKLYFINDPLTRFGLTHWLKQNPNYELTGRYWRKVS